MSKLSEAVKAKLQTPSGKLQLFFVCWFVSFILLGIFFTCVIFDSPIAAFNLTFSKLAVTDGYEISDCQPGGKSSYKYRIGNKNFESLPSGPCKVLIPAGKKFKIYYVIDKPYFSWVSSNPREDSADLFFVCFLFSLITAGRVTSIMAKKLTMTI